MTQLKKACDADFIPDQAFRYSKLNPGESPDKALEMYLLDRNEIEKRQPAFYEGLNVRRIDAYIKFMLKRLQYGLDISEWKLDD